MLLPLLLTFCALSGAPAAAVPVQQIDHLYPDGGLQSRGFYAGPTKVGHHQSWWPNGRLRSSAMYVDDAYHGEYRTWRENGHPYELRHFDHGRESGRQQSWNDDGTLFLNYEVRRGRRFGFINAAPCLPADHDGASKPVRAS
jgi:antitoxin component YwqK of YwqJK toxin-antitoxin module